MNNLKRYKAIVFDVDGTLIDTEKADISALRQLLNEAGKKQYEYDELRFAFGIPGLATLRKLGFEDIESASLRWNQLFKQHFDSVSIFDGITDVLVFLRKNGFHIGIVTSKTRTEFDNDFVPFGLMPYFDTVICADDTLLHKPEADPLLEFMKRTALKKKEVLYIGDSIYDSICASRAGVDFGTASWGAFNTENYKYRYYFKTPDDIKEILFDFQSA